MWHVKWLYLFCSHLSQGKDNLYALAEAETELIWCKIAQGIHFCPKMVWKFNPIKSYEPKKIL